MEKIIASLLLSFLFSAAFAQRDVPFVRTNTNSIIMNIGGEKGNFNGVNDIPKVFSYDLGIDRDLSILSLVSEKDSVAILLKFGEKAIFKIVREAKGDTVTCIFNIQKVVKAATFDETYKAANTGKTIAEIPEVYELINVIFSLTTYGQSDAIYKKTPYYQEVLKHFAPYKNLATVSVIDSLLKVSQDHYAPLKMDSYAFLFNGNKIEKSVVYDRISWGASNELEPYISLLESFAEKSGFRAFYQKHKSYYIGLESEFQKTVDLENMKRWLEIQFPGTRYSAVKVIFSPLVGWNQSANNFSDNGFTEAQAHVNFPFVNANNKSTPAVIRGFRSTIVFTELNHSYLNPEADKYSKQVGLAFKNISGWVTQGKPSAGYDSPLLCFEEYMNYGLVTLYYSDYFDAKTFETLISGMEENMVSNRGFQRFREFNQELLKQYKARKKGQTVADLYPAMIAWAGKM